ncbi:presequence protease, mitochondrial isoform X2 [Drosophila grimshawi]|nr:presequence protease, mitochondrial isoform X2 [Drosophila grimshawi]
MFKGVVYNEMKGFFFENPRICRQYVSRYLLPNSAYYHMAVGDPIHIPSLTHEDLIEFHRKYYHPSNARLYSYGSFDLMETLSFLDKEYLSKRDFQDTSYSIIPPQPRWTEPRRMHVSCRLDEEGASPDLRNQIAIAFLMCDRTDIQECFELLFLSNLLTRGPNAAFYKALVEMDSSGCFHKNTSYAITTRDTHLRVGLQDLRVEDFGKFIEIFDNTVHKTIEEGFEAQHIESCLHNLELSVKHQVPNFGKVILYNMMSVWTHGGDVVANLRIHEQIAKLKRNLRENKNYFQDKIKQYILNNPHKLTITMSPDEKFDENFEKAHKAVLQEKIDSLSAEDLQQIYKTGLKLEAARKAPVDLEILPCLSLKDVEEPLRIPDLIEEHIHGVPTQLCKVNTNGITYFNCLFNMAGLSQEDAKLVPLLCNVIQNMGTDEHSFAEFDKLVNLKTAGIEFQVKVVENVKDYEQYQMGLQIKTFALDQNVADMFALCEELLLRFTLVDIDRLKMLVDTYISKLSAGIIDNGHPLSMLQAASLVSNAAQWKSQLTGLDHIDFLREFAQVHSTEEIRDRLVNIAPKIFSKSNMRVAINTSESFANTALEHYSTFLQNLPTVEKMKGRNKLLLLAPSFQHYDVKISINFCVKAFYSVPYLHMDHPVLRVISKLVAAKYLMPVVRELNGAYGAGARIGYDGIFYFYSVRDEYSTKTLDTFDKTNEWLLSNKNKLDEQMLFEAKLGVLQLLDWPTAPGEKGLDYFITRVSQEEYVNYRKRMLAVTIDEVSAAINKYFTHEPKHVGKCILGAKDK